MSPDLIKVISSSGCACPISIRREQLLRQHTASHGSCRKVSPISASSLPDHQIHFAQQTWLTLMLTSKKKKTTRAPRHTLPSTIYSEQLGSGWELTPPGHPQGTGSSGFPSRKRSHVQQHPGTPSLLQESSLISSAQALLKIQGSTFKVLYGLGWMNAATDCHGTENKARRKTKPRCRQTKQLFHSDNLKAFKNHNMICCYHITVNNYLGASVHVNRTTYFKSILSSASETTKHVLTNQKLQQEKLVS